MASGSVNTQYGNAQPRRAKIQIAVVVECARMLGHGQNIRAGADHGAVDGRSAAKRSKIRMFEASFSKLAT